MMAVTAIGSGGDHRVLPSEVTRRLNPSVPHRLLVTLSFPLLILLAVPFWWYCTSIQRLPFPTARISALETSVVSAVTTIDLNS